MRSVQAGEPEVHRQRGKWVVRLSGYDPATGKRRVKQLGTFETKRAAEAHVRALTDGRVGTAGETLAEFLEEVWLPAKEGRVEVATFDQYSWAVRRHIVPLLGPAIEPKSDHCGKAKRSANLARSRGDRP